MADNERGRRRTPPPPQGEPQALNRGLLARMRRITQLHTALWQERVAELTKPQYGVARALLEAPEGLSQAQVGERVGMDKATLAQLVPRLEARGLLLRAVAPEDRRRRVLQLTDAGEELVRRVAPRVEALDEETMAALGMGERRELESLLGRLAAQ